MDCSEIGEGEAREITVAWREDPKKCNASKARKSLGRQERPSDSSNMVKTANHAGRNPLPESVQYNPTMTVAHGQSLKYSLIDAISTAYSSQSYWPRLPVERRDLRTSMPASAGSRIGFTFGFCAHPALYSTPHPAAPFFWATFGGWALDAYNQMTVGFVPASRVCALLRAGWAAWQRRPGDERGGRRDRARGAANPPSRRMRCPRCWPTARSHTTR